MKDTPIEQIVSAIAAVVIPIVTKLLNDWLKQHSPAAKDEAQEEA